MKPQPSRARHPRPPFVAALVLAALVASWVRSNGRADVLALYSWSAKVQALATSRGKVWFFVSGVAVQGERRLSWDHLSGSADSFESMADELAAASAWTRAKLGFRVGYDPAGPGRNVPGAYYFLAAPHGLFVALAGLWLLRGLGRYARYLRRRKRGLCLRCGYDLRESRGRCPECGEVREGVNSNDEIRNSNQIRSSKFE